MQVRKMKDFQQRLGNILTQISQNKIACQQTINNVGSLLFLAEYLNLRFR